MKFLFSIIMISAQLYSLAQLQVTPIFQSNMVLQQQKVNKIWGTAKPETAVQIEFSEKKYSAKANKKGDWTISLQPLNAGPAGSMTIRSGDEKIFLSNILIGEVWLCSGQSNMEYTMNEFKETYANEINTAQNDFIRYTTIKKTFNNIESSNVKLSKNWSSITSASIGDCSAVAYFYAKKLYEKLKVPIGIVNVAWSGTPAQAWVDVPTIKGFSNYDTVFTKKIAPLDFSDLELQQKKNEEKFQDDIVKSTRIFSQLLTSTYNDEDWEKMVLPQNWEALGHPNFDGIAVYRIGFDLASIENETATLHLPAIDDIDSTYINGHFVGSKRVWNELRVYEVPAASLKVGKNIITIWVEDDGGGGGLDNDPPNFYLQIGNKKITLSGEAKFKKLVAAPLFEEGINFNEMQYQPTVLFNGMISPLLNYTFKGVIWYQGESNAIQYKEYKTLFPALIKNWRKRFAQGDFPFLFVQLSSYNPMNTEPDTSHWAHLREVQQTALQLPNTGMAITYDVGDQWDIHPKKKKEVGDRLAANAFKMVYGFKNEIATGPLFKNQSVVGNSISISFTNIGKGLYKKGDHLLGFSIAGSNKKFMPATAMINGNKILVSAASISEPKYVRYAWANSPLEANLYNVEGFPAVPFRTDTD